MKKILQFLCFSIFTISTIALADAIDNKVINDPILLALAKQLPHSGTLQIENDGYTYLKVSDLYKTKLFPVLYQYKKLSTYDKNCLIPNINPIGMHISLYEPGVLTPFQIEKLKRLYIGKKLNFTVKKIMKFAAQHVSNGETYYIDWYVVSAESADIQELRNKIAFSSISFTPHISFSLAKHHSNGECACMCDFFTC